jgi:hypothetical protein
MSPSKKCPPGEVLNPATNRCVKINGKIGKAILAGKASEPSKPKTPKSHKCNNDYDPISMDYFSNMTEEELKSIVYIGPGEKKNCYLLDNIYEVYKTAVLNKKTCKDPMNPSHTLTTDEIAEINKMMKKKDPNYSKPIYDPFVGHDLEFRKIIVYSKQYYIMDVLYYKEPKKFLGTIPAWIEQKDTGNADHTSAVLINNIKKLWNRKKLIIESQGYLHCTLELNRHFQYWLGETGIENFIELCNAVRDKLIE